MKDLSSILLKISLGAKMRKGFGTFCNDDGSTSTLNQRQTNTPSPYYADQSHGHGHNRRERGPPPTLEEMIMKLEMEEDKARKAKVKLKGRRSSCVNSTSSCSDNILMSARDALSQYPRFSLDGKDAMYRSSFRTTACVAEGRRSVCCDQGTLQMRRRRCGHLLPPKVGGESVVWCKPGVVAKLMGLEVVPMPLIPRRRSTTDDHHAHISSRHGSL